MTFTGFAYDPRPRTDCNESPGGGIREDGRKGTLTEPIAQPIINQMRHCRRALRAAVICATAVMTLIVGMPHFVCRCPNGSVKPFCFGVSTDGTGCCCGSSCCSAQAGGRCCCCENGCASEPGQAQASAGCHGKNQGNSSQPTFHSSGNCCTKTLAQPEDSTNPPVRTEVAQDSTPLPFHHATGSSAHLLLPEVHCQIAWELHFTGPPTDLVITLQHFLI